jgi:hypothetical protein
MIVEEPRSEIELAVDHLIDKVVDFSTPEGMVDAMTAFTRGLAASAAALNVASDPDKSSEKAQRNVEYANVFFNSIENALWLTFEHFDNASEPEKLDEAVSLFADLLAKKIARCDPAGAITANAIGFPTENAKFIDRALDATRKLYTKLYLLVGLAPVADVISEELADSFMDEFHRHSQTSSLVKIGDFVTRLHAMFPQIRKKGESR